MATRAVALLLLGASFAALASGSAFATTDTWYGNGTDTKWSDTSNWVGGAIPTSGQDVVILPGSNGATNANAPDNLDQSFSLNSLTLGATTNSTTASSGYNITTTNSSTLTIAGGGFIHDNSGNFSTAGGVDVINVPVTFSGAGTISASGGSSLAFGTAGSVTLGGATAINVDSSSTLAFDNGLSGSGNITINNSNLGAGSLVFLGSTNTGNTSINAGTLTLGNGTASGTLGGNVTIASGAGLTFNEATAQTFSGAISNAGSITQEGTNGAVTITGAISGAGTVNVNSGTLILSGADTYTGMTIVAPTSTLQIGDGVTTGTTFASGVVTDATTSQVIFNTGSGNISYSNNTTGITGLGSLVVEGGNSLLLSGSVTQSGGITIQNGSTLELDAGATVPINGAIAINDTSTLAINTGSVVGLSGAITGTGNLTVEGTGTTTYIENNDSGFTGAVSVASGSTLQLGFSTNTAGSLGSTTYTDNGTIAFDEPNTAASGQPPSTYAFSGQITGGGTLSQIGGATLVIEAQEGYTGGTTIQGGSTLQLGASGSPGSITGGVSNGGTLSFNTLPSSNYNFSGAITGVGVVDVNVGAGNTVELSGANSYSGGTTIDSGTLAVVSHGNLGTGGISFTSATANATLEFLGGDTFTQAVSIANGGATFNPNGNAVVWSGTITGTGGLTLNDTGSPLGSLTITANDTYSGGTTIINGALDLGNGTTAGMIAGNINLNSNALVFNEPGATTFSGNISGAGGQVIQNGPGTVTLSGTNSYSGGTFIGDGSGTATLAVSSAANLGTGAVYMNSSGGSSATLRITGSDTFANALNDVGGANISVASGAMANWSGQVSGDALTVTGGGTLVLSNTSNNYNLGTVVLGNSTLSIDSDSELGNASGGLTLGGASPNSGGTLEATQNIMTGRSVALAGPGGTLETSANTVTLELTNGVSGTGALTVSGPGTVILAGTSTYTGNTNISSNATLQLGDGTNPGAIAGTSTVNDSGSLVFNEGGSATFSNPITGSGTVTQDDTTGGTLTLIGTQGYTGNTIINAGALQLGDGATNTGTVAGNIVDNTALIFDEPSNTTYAGVISSGGTVEVKGGKTLTLTGNNTYTGQTTIDAGSTLQVGNGAATGSIGSSAAIVDNGTLIIDTTGQTLVVGGITGNGTVSQTGAGTTVLSGTNTYAGPTTVSNGTLQIGNGTSGSLTSNIQFVNGGAVLFDSNASSTYGGVISGPGTVTIADGVNGTTVLTGNNTYTGTTTVTSGTLQIGNGGGTGAVAGNITNNANIVFDGGASPYAGAISGSGTVTIADATTGTTVFTGNNTYTGTTTVTSGTLQIGGGTSSTSGALTSNVSIASGANLTFSRADSSTYAGTISGQGSVTVADGTSGVTVLTGNNTYSGSTTIQSGTLQLGSATANAATGGVMNSPVTDNGTLAFDYSNSTTFNGIISGTGGVTQQGTGQTTLTSTESYQGATVVSGGTLLVNGSIASSSGVTVGSGGTIAGTGTISKLTVNNNGTVTTGSGGIGTLTVAGNFILGPGATYSAQVTPAASDLLKVNGTATLEGALTVTPTGTGFSATPIEILSSNGLSGTFSSVTIFGQPTQIPIVSYTADDVFLSFTPTVTSLLPTTSADTNQGRVGNAIDFALEHDNALAFEAVTSESGPTLTQTLSELSGETAVAFQNVAVSSVGSFMSTLFDPSVGGRGGLGAGIDGISDNHAKQQVAFNGADSDMPLTHSSMRAVTVWTEFYGYQNTTDGDMSLGTHKTTATQFGGTVGLDYRPKSGDGAIGIAFGMTGNSWDLAEQLGKGQATAYQVGTYYSRRFWDTYITAGLSYARYSTSTDRTVNLGGENVYHADFVSNSVAARAEAGHVFHTDIGRITPYANFQGDDIGVPHYAEQTQAGSTAYALTYTGKQHYDYTSEAGVAWNALIDRLTDIHARAGWLHDYAGGLSDTATFSAFNGASFLVDGASPPRDAAHVQLGLSHTETNIVLSLNGEAAIGGNASSYGGTASISYHW